MTSVWVEKQRQKVLKKLGADEGKQVSDEEVLKELRPIVESDLRLNYLVTGS